MFTSPRRSVQVAPRRSVAGRSIVIKQDVHGILCYFFDVNIEHEFQTCFRRDRQPHLAMYMIAVLVLSVIVLTAAAVESLTAETVTFAAMSKPSTLQRSPQKRVTWVKESDCYVVIVVFYVFAALSILFVHRKKPTALFFSDPRFDPIQLALLFFYQLVFVPILLTLSTCIDLEISYAQDLRSESATVQRLFAFLGVSLVDMLYFYLLLLTTFASSVLRIQFTYYIAIVVEFIAIASTATGTNHGVDSNRIPDRWFLFVALVVTLLLEARGVWEIELANRREFLTHSNLLNENRRLSHQNIEMKEELTGKLNYQLHYEMGDILRILCQIKLKMSMHERKDIDKIITALVTNEGLFEVSLDPSMTEHEEEVQGWLHMMAFKEAPPAFVRTDSQTEAQNERKASRRPAMVMQSQVSRSTQSRKMSQGMTIDNRGNAVVARLFASSNIAEDTDELTLWLMDSLRDEVYVDMFHLEQRCSVPMQVVLVACIEVNDFATRLMLDVRKLVAFAGAVENHYFKRNPYHNCLHAAAVISDLNFYMRRLKLSIDDSTFFVGLIAAAAHDISHPGVSNSYLIATRSKLAITYSDDSVLERMHIAELYRILSHDKFDVFSHMDNAAKTETRKLIIHMILATDLSRHFQHISKLKSRKFAVAHDNRGLEVTIIMETMLMLSDLGHTVKPFAYHHQWANRIAEEFFRQGEAEERQNLPISPLCDRRQANLPRSQVAFLTLLATPLFETAGDAFAIDEYDTLMTDLRNNVKSWLSMIARSESTDGTASVQSNRGMKDTAIGEEDEENSPRTRPGALPDPPTSRSSDRMMRDVR